MLLRIRLLLRRIGLLWVTLWRIASRRHRLALVLRIRHRLSWHRLWRIHGLLILGRISARHGLWRLLRLRRLLWLFLCCRLRFWFGLGFLVGVALGDQFLGQLGVLFHQFRETGVGTAVQSFFLDRLFFGLFGFGFFLRDEIRNFLVEYFQVSQG